MDFDAAHVSLVGLRVFREVAERGTFTAAAASLGYTQSAVSRQIAALERAAGTALVERHRDGARLTAAGEVVLARASAALDQIEAAARELAGEPARRETVRLGWIPSAGPVLLPRALAALRREHPEITVLTREGSTAALVRALRAGRLDLALLASVPPYRPPDTATPPLRLRTIAERPLLLAVPARHPFARENVVDVADLRGQRWIAAPSSGEETMLGVWPGLDSRPEVAHTARDWLAKLRLVAAGCGITTVTASLAEAVPAGVRVVAVRGGPAEVRRLVVATVGEPLPAPVARVADALRDAAAPSGTGATDATAAAADRSPGRLEA